MLAERLAQGDAPHVALRTALHAVLLSPRFLLRLDTLGGTLATPDALAHRLTHALWGLGADPALAEAPPASPEDVGATAVQLLEDPRADWIVEGFGAGWLGLAALEDRTDLDPTLVQAMRDETLAVLDEHLRQDRPLAELTTRTDSLVPPALGPVYGVDVPAGTEGPVSVEVGRPGLLGHGSLLAATSRPGETSPVKRGVFLLDHLLCDPPEAPPPGVPSLDEADGDDARSQLAAHRADPACAGCHDAIDPMGLPLEGFGPDGAARDVVVPPETLPDGTVVDGPQALGAWIAAHDRTLTCTTALFATWSLGERHEADEPCVQALAAQARADGGRFSDVVRAVLSSPPFLAGGGAE